MTALIFDLDDTLLDHALMMSRFLREFYAIADPAPLLAVDARGKAPREELCRAIGAVVGREPTVVWDDVQRHLGRFAQSSAPHVVERALGRFEVAILTNGGSQNQRTKIATLGLDAMVPPARVLISAELGWHKPDARAFAAALAAVGAASWDAVYVGDDPHHDIAGAHAAGMRACWVARGRPWADTRPPDWTIETIADLPSVWDEFGT